MSISLVSIYIGGSLSLLMAIFHTQFFKIFRWKIDFRKISETNKKIFYTIHVALFLLFFGVSYISFVYAVPLSNSIGLAFGINLIFSLLWLWRAIWQIIYFKPDKKSKFLIMHFILIIIFFILFISYALPIVLKFLI